MTPLRVIFCLLLVVACMLLAAGCAGQPAMKTPVNSTTIAVSPSPAVVTTALVAPLKNSLPDTNNGSYWIRINPIDKVEKGDTVHISGTTNLPAGKTLELMLYSGEYHPGCKCCFSDEFIADVKIRKGDECGNTFNFWFDSTNYMPQEYFVYATWTENSSVTNYLLFSLLENSTPQSSPSVVTGENDSINTSFAVLPIGDVQQGDIQTIRGIRKGSAYAIQYSIHDARYEPVYFPHYRGDMLSGTFYPVMSGSGSDRFALRFDTRDFEPGQYVADLDLTCSDATARGWFNVTPKNTVIAP